MGNVLFALVNDYAELGKPLTYAYLEIMKVPLIKLAELPICSVSNGRMVELNKKINSYGMPTGENTFLDNRRVIISILINDANNDTGISTIELINRTCEVFGVYHIICTNWCKG